MTTRSHPSPKATFDNLPAAKRRRIVKLAIEEFADRPYSQASLSRIVARAGIAKGSMYQYFRNKLDLYRWLLTQELVDQKRAVLDEAVVAAPSDLFARLELMVSAGVRFQLENPRLASLAASIFEPESDASVRALHLELREAGHAGLRAMLAEAVRDGALPASLDLDLAARITARVLGPGLSDVLLARLGTDLRGLLKNPSLARALPDAELRALVRNVLGFLRHGLAGAPTGAPTGRGDAQENAS